MASKPKLLLLASRVPYPPIGGDRLKNLNLIRKLSRSFEIHLIMMADSAPSAEAMEVLGGHCMSVEVVHLPKWRSLLSVILAVFSSCPLQVAYYLCSAMKKAVKAKAGNVTAVLATTQRTAIYAKDLSCPKVLDIADSQARNTANAYKSTSSPIWKMIYWLESRRIGAFELECISRFDKTLFFNMEESESFGMPAKTRWIPHGVQGELFTRALPQERERAVVFFGKMDYRPNVEAVEWFCEHVLPLLPTDVRFYILGAAPNATVRALGERHAQVKVTGFLDDPYELILQCGLVVAPMQSGSGIQNKVLEAMALGMAVVGTSRAFTPILGAREGEHFIAENSAEGTAKAILALLDDPETRDRMGLTARAFISTNFSWEKWEETILDVLVEAIEAHKVVPPPAT